MKLSLGGKNFELKPLNLNDWVKIEDSGINLDDAMKGKIKFKDLRTIAFVALHKVDNSIDENWVGENIALDDMGVITKIINFISPKGSAKDGK